MYVERVEPFIGKCGPLIRQEIEKGEIKKFALATCETNPIYFDEEYAKNTEYKRIIAPPTFYRTLQFGDIPDFDLPRRGRVHAEQEYKYFKPVGAGDVVYCQNKIVKTYEKQGRSGFMLFVVFEHAVYDEFGNPYCIGLITSLFKENVLTGKEFQNSPDDKVKDDDWNIDITPIDVSSVKEGYKIELVEFPKITKTRIAKWAGATGDFNPIHFEDEAASAAGLSSVIAHGMIGVAMQGNVLNSWMNNKGTIKNIKIRFVSSVYPGDTLSCEGVVTKVEHINGKTHVECDLVASNQKNEKVLSTSAILELKN